MFDDDDDNDTINNNNEKAPRETQTLRAGCTIGGAKNFRPAADPFPVARDGQNLGDGHYLYLQTQFGEIDARNFE